MGSFSSLLWGAAIGAGIMYFLDPQQGNRRKAMVRDQVISLRSQGDEAINMGVRDVRHRIRGLLAEGIAMVDDQGMPDYILEERVRSKLGFLTRHPGAVQVAVQDKKITLTGDILADEVDNMVMGISRVRGLKGVQNNLHVHQEAGNIPQLQGEGWLPGQSQGSTMWSPSTRLFATAGAGYLLLYGLFKGGFVGFLAKAVGAGLAARALSNQDLRTLTGRGEFESVRVRKSININAPVDQVYGLWSNFANFSQFMANIEEVRDMGNGLSHWVVKGPAGSKVEFDAVMTENRPNEVVAWETTPESQVKHRGQVRFKENEKGTQVNVNMAYSPPAGVAGHAVAKLFGKDPKTEMDADLARMKTLLEKGKTSAKNQQVTRDRVMPVTGGEGEGPMGTEGQNRRNRKNQSGPMEGSMSDRDMDMGMDELDDQDVAPLPPTEI